MSDGATWLASYPKSGNTWLRCLLDAYRRNGALDINDIRVGTSDGAAVLIRAVSPVPLKDLGFNGQMLLRPAALIHLLCRHNHPRRVKTHFANFQPDGLPHCIPKEFTERAVYVVRDPRSVLLSMARFFGFSTEAAVEAMNNKQFTIGDNEEFASTLVSSWSNHARSWVGEKNFPVHVVRYEDMLADAGKELTEVLEFLGEDVDPALVETAVDAAALSRLKAKESDDGFRENSGQRGDFFNEGGVRWESELGPRWIERIEQDHGDVMRALGYLDAPVAELRSVE